MNGNRLAAWMALAATLALSGCRTTGPSDGCGPFPDDASSPYRLPYPVGTGYEVNQSNCSGKGHSGFWRYGYDFTMPIGTLVTAAREGVAILSVGHCVNGDGNCTNQVAIEHEDGEVTVYTHLTHEGALVAEGTLVEAGDPIARSGNTGYTGGFPHLHFSLHPCRDISMSRGACPSIPVTFRNTDPNPNGLVAKRAYVAR